MSIGGNMDSKMSIFARCLTESDTFPYDVRADNVVSMSISNTGTVDFVATITYKDPDKAPTNVIVPAGKDLYGTFYEIAEIGSPIGDAFVIALFSRGGAV